MSNSTNVTRTFNVLSAAVPSWDTGKQTFTSNRPLALTNSGWQIDELIGFTKANSAVNGTSPYNLYHWTQWSTSNTPATGNVLSAWVSYIGADTQVTDGTSNINVLSTVTFSSATSASVV